MTAPFQPQTPDTLPEIRFYTPFDPYFYSVDNRPLADLQEAIRQVSGGGGDSARRAVAYSQVVTGAVATAATHIPDTAYAGVDGFNVTLLGNILRIGHGALYQQALVNDAVTYSMLKVGVCPQIRGFTLVPPSLPEGDARDYLVQVKYQALDQGSIPDSRVPYMDAANTQLPCLLVHGEALVSLKEGAVGTYGSQVTPEPDDGWYPLYVVTLASDPTLTRVKAHASAPYAVGSVFTKSQPTPNQLPAGAGDLVPVSIRPGVQGLDPTRPIRVRLLLGSSVGSGTVSLRLSYKYTFPGSVPAGAYTVTSPADVVAIPGSAGALVDVTLVNSVIPPHVFSSFRDDTWKPDPGLLQVAISRTSSTNTGDVTVYEVTAFQ